LIRAGKRVVEGAVVSGVVGAVVGIVGGPVHLPITFRFCQPFLILSEQMTVFMLHAGRPEWWSGVRLVLVSAGNPRSSL